MTIKIPTSPEVAQKIEKLFNDKVLKPKNMSIVARRDYEDTTIIVIDWKHGELSDVFFLGYWTNKQ